MNKYQKFVRLPPLFAEAKLPFELNSMYTFSTNLIASVTFSFSSTRVLTLCAIASSSLANQGLPSRVKARSSSAKKSPWTYPLSNSEIFRTHWARN